MNWGGNALVLEPDSLREAIREEAEQIVKKYQNTLSQESIPLISTSD